MPTKRFQVAFSFPGEKRNYVLRVAELLASKLGRDTVFYDDWYKHELARPNLDTYLQTIYHQQSQLIIPFLCADFERKQWCGLEWRAIRDLIKQRQDEDIMPLRFDDTHISGLFNIDGYIDLRIHTSEQIAELILKRLRTNRNPIECADENDIPKDPSIKFDENLITKTINFELSEEARQILIAGIENPRGGFSVSYRGNRRGLKIQARGHLIKWILDDKRSMTLWEDAVQQLLNNKLSNEIKNPKNNLGKLFEITHKGYEVGDILKSQAG